MTTTSEPTTGTTGSALRVLDVPLQGPLDHLGRLLHAEDPAAQLALALANLEDALTAADLVPAELTHVSVLAVDVDLVLGVLDTLTDRLVEVGAGPETDVVAVTHLPVPGQLVAVGGRASSTGRTTTTRTTTARTGTPVRPRESEGHP